MKSLRSFIGRPASIIAADIMANRIVPIFGSATPSPSTLGEGRGEGLPRRARRKCTLFPAFSLCTGRRSHRVCASWLVPLFLCTFAAAQNLSRDTIPGKWIDPLLPEDLPKLDYPAYYNDLDR